MADRSASRTAMGVCVLRAAHTLLDGPPLILVDAVAAQLLDPATRDWVVADPPQLQAAGARALRGHVVTRGRFAEDRCAAAVARGVAQYVLLGAGYDTFAYRQPAWAGAIRIFEVDLPATQADKRARLAAASVPLPPNLTFVPIDFAAERLEARLREAGFDPDRPAVFAWLGVTMYLEAEANDAVFRYVAARPPGSELIFTFAPEERENAPGGSRIAALAADAGEPWRTFYDPDALAERLGRLGFSSVWMPTPAELAAAYFQQRPDTVPVPRRRTLASAMV